MRPLNRVLPILLAAGRLRGPGTSPGTDGRRARRRACLLALHDGAGGGRRPTGMVATDAPLATAVGVDVAASRRQRGGRRGGDGLRSGRGVPRGRKPRGWGLHGGPAWRRAEASLDFREEAPGAATADMYLDEAGNVTDRSVTGHLAAGVPGAVAGLWAAHQRFGTLPWAEL